MSWIYLALLAPFISAIVNLLDDNLLQHVYRSSQAGAVVSGLFAIFPALLILSLNDQGLRLPEKVIYLAIASGFLTVVGFYCYFRGLENENPSVVAALFSLTPALIPFAAYFLVDERLSLQSAIGFGTVTLAAFLYSLSDIRKFKISKALFPIIVATLLFDVASLASKYVYTQVEFYPAYFYFSIGMFVAGLFFLALLPVASTPISLRTMYQKNPLKLLLLLAVVEVVGLTAQFTHDRALSLGSVSIVAGLENLQPLYIVLISMALFPFFPKYFREAEQGFSALKILLLVAMIFGAYLAVG